MVEDIKVGDWVMVTAYNGHTNHSMVGSRGQVVDQDGTYDYKVQWLLNSPAHTRLYTRYSWLRPDEISLSEPPAPTTEDQDLRDAISALPGLENASLTWDEDTDPVDFITHYGEVLGDLLKYYKKKEAKLEKISEALEVLYDV